MITPTTEMGRPAAIAPRTIVGDTIRIADHTNQRDEQQREASMWRSPTGESHGPR